MNVEHPLEKLRLGLASRLALHPPPHPVGGAQRGEGLDEVIVPPLEEAPLQVRGVEALELRELHVCLHVCQSVVTPNLFEPTPPHLIVFLLQQWKHLDPLPPKLLPHGHQPLRKLPWVDLRLHLHDVILEVRVVAAPPPVPAVAPPLELHHQRLSGGPQQCVDVVTPVHLESVEPVVSFNALVPIPLRQPVGRDLVPVHVHEAQE
mmetsp:Transcript_22612/g.56562  ORF Transcript_22612/g.56562 Transcript_22612/m.56562 type:complete len:205 (-) Transcript_22612:265-879(-)